MISYRPWYCTGCGAVLPDGDDYVRPIHEVDLNYKEYNVYCPACGWSGEISPDLDIRDERSEQPREAEVGDDKGKSRSPGDLRPAPWREPINGEDGAPKFPYVHSPLYGEIPAPTSLDMLMRYVESVRWARPWLGGWRGQADIGWMLESTAARRLNSHRDRFGDLPNRALKNEEAFEDERRRRDRGRNGTWAIYSAFGNGKWTNLPHNEGKYIESGVIRDRRGSSAVVLL